MKNQSNNECFPGSVNLFDYIQKYQQSLENVVNEKRQH